MSQLKIKLNENFELIGTLPEAMSPQEALVFSRFIQTVLKTFAAQPSLGQNSSTTNISSSIVKLTDEKKAKIIKLYTEGLTAPKIGIAIGMSSTWTGNRVQALIRKGELESRYKDKK